MSDNRAAAMSALGRGLRFLLDTRQPAEHGLPCFWKEFSVFGRSSDEWVTAYTAAALAETEISEACDAADTAWQFLTAQRSQIPTGLGYNWEAPRDADSTLWGCRLTVLLGRTSDDWFRRAIEFMAGPQPPPTTGCLRTDGGIATYPSADCLTIELRNNTRVATDGWRSSHVCVTAAAAWLTELLSYGDLIGFLTRTQSSRGCWESYWWTDPEYATAHAVESLARHDSQRECIERAAVWLEDCPAGASSFQLALRIIGLSAANPSRADALLAKLLELQLDDGSWASSARMRIPPPNLRNPDVRWNWNETNDGFGGIVVDRARIFTTATAVRALTSCLAR
ncbi:MAG: hypothetical protein WBW33_28425 [Bryobacteraceae bacterium]